MTISLMTFARTGRGVAILMLALPAFRPLCAQQPPSHSQHHAPTCARALRKYDAFTEVPVPHDTLPPPRVQGSFNSAEEMEAARREGIAATGATGFVLEQRSELAGPGGVAMRTMSRVTPVFVPADSARVRAVCGAPTPRH